MKVTDYIGTIVIAVVLFCVMTLLVPALISAKSTIAVLSGFLIALAVISGTAFFAAKALFKVNSIAGSVSNLKENDNE